MDRLSSRYKSLLETCYEFRNNYGEDDLGLFSAGVGISYNHRLMVVGRATNGWGNDFDKNKWSDYDDLIANYLPHLSSETLDWLKGDTNGWNQNRSAFWRLAKMLARSLSSNTDDCADYIAYSNLYKVSNDGRNPSAALMDLEFDHCVEILRGEIEILQPENVVFLTGVDWAVPFLDRLEIANQLPTSDFEYVKFGTRVKDRNYVVCTHPQGKPGLPQFNDIIRVLDQLSGHLKN